jgi:transposase
MARYKPYDLKQAKMIPLSYADQIVPGSFEYALDNIVEEHLDLGVFDRRYRNDQTGRLAYDPKVMLKIVLYGYYKGLISSRDLEEACRRNVVFMALSADTRPHFTTIAGFITELDKEIVELFCEVLLYCDELGLIGKEHFAIDGCKLPSNASKQWSGTLQELKEKQEKMEAAVRQMVERHRERDEAERQGPAAQREDKKLATYRAKIEKIKGFLAEAKPNMGPSGKERKSNITDPQSAKMSTSHGVVQGYNGVAVVDDRHQIVVCAEVHGNGQEQELLVPTIAGVRENFKRIGNEGDIFEQAQVTADSGFHSAKGMEQLQQLGVDAYIADANYRKRDAAFAKAGRYKERHRKEQRERSGAKERKRFGPEDFIYDDKQRTCICLAGKKLYRSGNMVETGGCLNMRFRAPKSACRPCALRGQCLKYPQRTVQRQVAFFIGRAARAGKRAMDVMRGKFDSTIGRLIYAKRIGTVEPVFGNCQNKGMKRFTLRGKGKVNVQWNLFMLAHGVVSVKWWKKADVTSGHLSHLLIANLLVSPRSPQNPTRTDAL